MLPLIPGNVNKTAIANGNNAKYGKEGFEFKAVAQVPQANAGERRKEDQQVAE